MFRWVVETMLSFLLFLVMGAVIWFLLGVVLLAIVGT